MTENKLKKKKQKDDESVSKGHRSQQKGLAMAKSEWYEQSNKVILGYIPKYKIKIHESTQIRTNDWINK